MKNYKVIALRDFNDAIEKEPRTKGKYFECTKERYIYLKGKGAVELVEIIEEKKEVEDLSIDPYKDFEVKEEKPKAKKTAKQTSKK